MGRVGAWSGFVPVVRSHELRRAPLRVVAEGAAVVLFRDHEGRAAALLDRCPHRFAPLSAGRIRPDGRIACPYHGWSFDRDGCGRSPSEPERVDCDTVAFRVREEGGMIFVAPPPRPLATSDDDATSARAAPEATWISRPTESPLHDLGLGRARAGELRLARLVPALGPAPIYRRYRVARREDEADGLVSFSFVPAEDRELFSFRPGQHVMVRVPLDDARRIARAYSLSDLPDGERYRVTVRRVTSPAPGAVSSHLHDRLGEGAEIEVSDPMGDFVLADPARPLLFIAGGVGITPIFGMLKAVAARPRGEALTVLYSVRSPREIFRRREIDALARQAGGVVRYFVTGEAGQAGKPARGRIDADALRPHVRDEPDVYLCGPEGMLASMRDTLVELGVPPARIRDERFRAALGPHVAALPDVDVTFARSKRTLRWSPNAGTLLDLASASGISLESGCRIGSCGTCRVRLERGEVLRSAPGTATVHAKGTCLPCVAVPRGDVVLDA